MPWKEPEDTGLICIHCGEAKRKHKMRHPNYPDVSPLGHYCPAMRGSQFEEATVKEQQKHLEFRQRVRDQEACRVTVIHCLDMLKTLHEKLSNAIPECVDPHGMKKSWLTTAERNLELLLEAVIESEL
jgi:hypothetical protein